MIKIEIGKLRIAARSLFGLIHQGDVVDRLTLGKLLITMRTLLALRILSALVGSTAMFER